MQLWPEHFDVAVDLGDAEAGTRANFGASPGDAADDHRGPYLYVGPWMAPPGSESFWDATHFAGAVLAYADIVAAEGQREAALAFLRRGRALLEAHERV